MPLNIPTDYYETSFVHQQVSTLRLAVCTLGFHHLTGTFGTDTDAVESSWQTNVQTPMSNQWRLVAVNWRSAAGTVQSRSFAHLGADSAAAAPPQVAYLIRKTTGLPGRKGRGRIYLPGPTESTIDSTGQLSSARHTAVDSAFSTFFSDCLAANMEPYILHNSATAPTPITQFSTEFTVATQRRRLRG